MYKAAAVMFMIGMETSTQWAAEHFGGAHLGDRRLSARLEKTGARMITKAGASLPEQFGGDKAGLVAAYRLLNNTGVMPQLLMSARVEKVLEQCRARELILCVQDTTELDFTSREVEGLGEIGNGRGQGLMQHSVLAVDPQGRKALGVLHVDIHWRVKAPKGETRVRRQSRPTQRARPLKKSGAWTQEGRAWCMWATVEPTGGILCTGA